MGRMASKEISAHSRKEITLREHREGEVEDQDVRVQMLEVPFKVAPQCGAIQL